MNKPNRFRFRIYDHDDKRMLSCGVEWWRIQWENAEPSFSPCTHPSANLSPLMQSTGLCDANYREIFEGDIIALFDFDNQYDGAGYKVYFSRGSFIISIEGKEHILATYYDSKSVEVVGNIYENPERLK